MAKELSLSELAASPKANIVPTKSEQDEQIKNEAAKPTEAIKADETNVAVDAMVAASQPKNVPLPKRGGMPAEKPAPDIPKIKRSENIQTPNGNTSGKTVRVGSDQVAARMMADGKIPNPNNTPPRETAVVDDAFKSFGSTLAQRKQNIEKALETMQHNAEEIAMERTLGTDDEAEAEEEKINDTGSNGLDDFLTALDGDFDEDESKPTERRKESAPVSRKEDPSEKKYKIEGEDKPVKEASKSEEAPKPKTESNRSHTPPVEDKPIEKTASAKVAYTENTPLKSDFDNDNGLGDLVGGFDEQESKIDEFDEETPQEIREKFKKAFENVPIIRNPIDLKRFTIRKKPVSVSFVLNNIKSGKQRKTADWPLLWTQKNNTYTETEGPELDALRKTLNNSNELNRVINALKFVYNHVQDANKPPFEEWCKTIRTEDITSLYFGPYFATYSDTNYLARLCDKCHKHSLIETPIMDMVRYGGEENDDAKPEEIKEKFQSILQNDSTTDENVFESTIMQISDELVISYRPATLYSTFIQYSTLPREITERFNETLNMMAYIEDFFYIDGNELAPVDIPEFPKNIRKSVIARLKVFANILNGLTSDQYITLQAKMQNLIGTPRIYYVYPKCTCPECGAEIPETPVDSVLNLLFMRAQLAQVKAL